MDVGSDTSDNGGTNDRGTLGSCGPNPICGIHVTTVLGQDHEFSLPGSGPSPLLL